MKIIRYVVKDDVGLAPNPFHGWCTLAVCTPNHQRAKVDPGDWIVGNSERPKGGTDSDRRLIYAMRVDKILSMDQYFHAKEFQAKKPNPRGTPETQCGDNFYFRDSVNQSWRRLPSMFHNDQAFFLKDLGKDLSGRKVFVGREFYYFGENAKKFPAECNSLIATGRGVRTYGDADIEKGADQLYEKFVAWLQKNHKPGCLGMPRDMVDTPVTEPMVTSYPCGFDENLANLNMARQGEHNSASSRHSGILRTTIAEIEVANAEPMRGCAPSKSNSSRDKQ
jgi:hypothetical protein